MRVIMLSGLLRLPFGGDFVVFAKASFLFSQGCFSDAVVGFEIVFLPEFK
jgi:hypothetical protein